MTDSTLIATTRQRGLHAVGTAGQPVMRAYDQITRYLAQNLSPQHAALFAEPNPNAARSTVDWYTSESGPVTRYLDSDDETRAAATKRLAELREEIEARASELTRSKEGGERFLGQMLKLALEIPGEDFIYLVSGQPVLVCWGNLHDSPQAERGVLGRLVRARMPQPLPRPAPSAAAVAVAAAPPPATAVAGVASVPVTATVFSRGWGWLTGLLWLLFALLLFAVFFVLLSGCGVGPRWLVERSLVNFCPIPVIDDSGDERLLAVERNRTDVLEDQLYRLRLEIAQLDVQCRREARVITPVPPRREEPEDEDRIEVVEVEPERDPDIVPVVPDDDADPVVVVEDEEPEVLVEDEEPEVAVEEDEPDVVVEDEEPEVVVEEDEPEAVVEDVDPEAVVEDEDPEAVVDDEDAEVAVDVDDPETVVDETAPPPVLEEENPEALVTDDDPEAVTDLDEPEVVEEEEVAAVPPDTEEAEIPEVDEERVEAVPDEDEQPAEVVPDPVPDADAPEREEPTPPLPEEEEAFDERLDREEGERGEVTVTLMWNGDADLDLRVTCPNGEEVFFNQPNACGGTLDVDMNAADAGGPTSDEPVENIVWEDGAPSGRYRVRVDNYESRSDGDNATPFRLRVINGDETEIIEGSIREDEGEVTYYEFVVP